VAGKSLIEPLHGNGRLSYFPTSIFRLLGSVYRALLSNGFNKPLPSDGRHIIRLFRRRVTLY
jgi:hypothetical protein